MRFVFSAIWLGLLFALVFAGSSRAEDAFVVEPGFKSLFNGSDLTGWRLDKDTLDGKTATIDHRYVVKDGVLVITGASPGQPPMNAIDTVAEFNQDFVLRLEFRALRDANSGIHLRDRDFKHQLQIRDYPRVGPYKMLTHYKQGDWNAIEVTLKNDSGGKGATALCTCNGEVLEKSLACLPEARSLSNPKRMWSNTGGIRIKEIPR